MTSTFQGSPDARTRFPSAGNFPSKKYDDAAEYFDAYVSELKRAASSVDRIEVERAARLLMDAYLNEATVFSCGNGGSASISGHMGCDHVKGIRTSTDLLPSVVSLSTNVSLLTAIANDIGYEETFAYQLQSHARPGDVLVAISSSGRSPNIVRAVEWASENGLKTIALTGFDGGDAATSADVSIHVDSENYGIIEDLHQAAMHAIAQYLRQTRMSPDAIASLAF